MFYALSNVQGRTKHECNVDYYTQPAAIYGSEKWRTGGRAGIICWHRS